MSSLLICYDTRHTTHLRRSQRALLTYWAPASGTSVKALVRVWVSQLYFRREPFPDSSETRPRHTVTLTTAT